MAVRLGFAIAAHSDPDVLLVDEVLAVGDEAFAHRASRSSRSSSARARRSSFVSHDLALVAERCRRAIWLEHGRLAADGPAAEIVARYREQRGAPTRAQRARARARAPAGAIGSGVGHGRARAPARPARARPVGRLRVGRGGVGRDGRARRRRAARRISSSASQIATVAGRGRLRRRTRALEGLRPERFAGDARVVARDPRARPRARRLRARRRGARARTAPRTTTGATCCASR